MHTLKTLMIASCLAVATPVYAKDVSTVKKHESLHTYPSEKGDVDKAFAEWRAALSSGSADKVVKLYDKDAVLLATLAAKPITTQAGRMEYFSKLTAKPELSATVNEQYTRLLDEDNAVISGIYTFRFKEEGKEIAIPARFSFVYAKENGKWMIVDHHSSKLPEMQ